MRRDDDDEYRRLYLTAQGQDAVKDDYCDVEWRASTAPAPRPKHGTDTGDALPESDGVLFETLRAWRREQAEATNVPPFVIFADKVLHAICAVKPANEIELGDVSGIGPAKSARFGEAIVEIVRKHKRDN